MIVTFKKPSPRWTAVSVVLVILLAAVTLTAVDARRPAIGKGDITNELPPSVQMQFMRPDQLEAAARKFPVVYVPFGLIEWHGKHLPLGTDALKAHGILVKTAEQFGGVVYPPVYFHNGFDQKTFVPVLTELFERLKKTGFRVIIGVSGHNVRGQIDM
ncbi:MAG: creatininase family protein, partial [Planctomycetota bacterium]